MIQSQHSSEIYLLLFKLLLFLFLQVSFHLVQAYSNLPPEVSTDHTLPKHMRRNLNLNLHNLLHEARLRHSSGRPNVTKPLQQHRPAGLEVPPIRQQIVNADNVLHIGAGLLERRVDVLERLLALLGHVAGYPGRGVVVSEVLVSLSPLGMCAWFTPWCRIRIPMVLRLRLWNSRFCLRMTSRCL